MGLWMKSFKGILKFAKYLKFIEHPLCKPVAKSRKVVYTADILE